MMIYLSGNVKEHHVVNRKDIGLMVSYHKRGLTIARARLLNRIWAADNGCFKNPDLNVDDYLRWLVNLQPYQRNCLFATAPDVVGNARATWERSESVLPAIRALGFKAALVAQDGIEDRPVRWGAFDVLFIGGTTEWKLSRYAFDVMLQAKREGLWIHMGRVNSRKRLRIAELSGVDSADGTTFCYGPDKRTKQMKRWLDEIKNEPFLLSYLCGECEQ